MHKDKHPLKDCYIYEQKSFLLQLKLTGNEARIIKEGKKTHFNSSPAKTTAKLYFMVNAETNASIFQLGKNSTIYIIVSTKQI